MTPAQKKLLFFGLCLPPKLNNSISEVGPVSF